MALYKRLGAETGMDVGIRPVSNIRLALTRDRLDEYSYYTGISRTIGGIEVEVLTPEQLKELWPLVETEGLLGATRRTATSSPPPSPRRWPAARATAGARSTATRPSRRSSARPAASGW